MRMMVIVAPMSESRCFTYGNPLEGKVCAGSTWISDTYSGDSTMALDMGTSFRILDLTYTNIFKTKNTISQ
jgi:hypothetical protein